MVIQIWEIEEEEILGFWFDSDLACVVPIHTNVAPPHESSSGPDNVVVVSTDRGHIPPSRPAFVRHASTNQGGSTIKASGVSLISHRPILALTNDNVTIKQPTATSSSNEGNQFDHSDMDTQTHHHFVSAAIDVEGRSGGLAVFWNDSNIPIEGHPFTWIKSQGTPHVIEERLDRAMVSTSWLHLFPNNSWLREPDLEDVVIEGWGGSDTFLCYEWRIGSGDNIRVMYDPWLRGSDNRWVSSPQPADNASQMELMYTLALPPSRTGRWLSRSRCTTMTPQIATPLVAKAFATVSAIESNFIFHFTFRSRLHLVQPLW
ncbi:hypothetical protein P8452_42367 [Trifolium repens]|nr:hypothetical protein P8452_42367 [Trifolium repens]